MSVRELVSYDMYHITDLSLVKLSGSFLAAALWKRLFPTEQLVRALDYLGLVVYMRVPKVSWVLFRLTIE